MCFKTPERLSSEGAMFGVAAGVKAGRLFMVTERLLMVLRLLGGCFYVGFLVCCV